MDSWTKFQMDQALDYIEIVGSLRSKDKTGPAITYEDLRSVFLRGITE